MLKRTIGLLDVFCVACGAMVSSGIFVLPGLAHAMAGPAVVFSYFFAGLLAACGMFSVAEIITAMPKAGGVYFYATRTMGPAVGTVTGLLVWFSLALKSSFALVGLSAFVRLYFDVPMLPVGVGICLFFLGANIVGVRETVRVQNIMVLTLLAIMVGYVLTGAPHVRLENFAPFVPLGWHAVFSTTGVVFISYGGLLAVSSMAEEVEDPGRVLPRALILALACAVLLYTACVFITTGVLPSRVLDNSLTPMTDGGRVFGGEVGAAVLSFAAALAFVSTVNSGLMASSRYLLGLSRDKYVPAFIGRLNSRFSTPHVALTITSGLVIGTLFLQLEVLVQAASTVLILTIILTNVCVVVLRESRLANYRPLFKAPFYPWVQVAGILGPAFLLEEMGAEALLLATGLMAAGLLFYAAYGRFRRKREFALQHLLERVLERGKVEGRLERELKLIVRERDDASWDDFDRLVSKAAVVDLQTACKRGELYQLCADALVRKTSLPVERVLALIRERESGGLDVPAPGVAMADIPVPGEGVLDMVMVRNSCPVAFRGGAVEAFFCIALSNDQRRMYISCVAALAQMLMDEEFLPRWRKAKDGAGLKDVLHLGRRLRGTPSEKA